MLVRQRFTQFLKMFEYLPPPTRNVPPLGFPYANDANFNEVQSQKAPYPTSFICQGKDTALSDSHPLNAQFPIHGRAKSYTSEPVRSNVIHSMFHIPINALGPMAATCDPRKQFFITPRRARFSAIFAIASYGVFCLMNGVLIRSLPPFIL